MKSLKIIFALTFCYLGFVASNPLSYKDEEELSGNKKWEQSKGYVMQTFPDRELYLISDTGEY